MNSRDEERVSFGVSREHFLDFADAVAVLADAERSEGAEEGTGADSTGPVSSPPYPVRSRLLPVSLLSTALARSITWPWITKAACMSVRYFTPWRTDPSSLINP